MLLAGEVDGREHVADRARSRPAGSRPAIVNGRATFSRTERIGRRLKNWKTKPVFAAAELRRLVVAEVAHDGAVEDDLAGRRAVEAAEEVEQRALAGARRAHDGDELAGLDRSETPRTASTTDAAHPVRSGRGRAPRGSGGIRRYLRAWPR